MSMMNAVGVITAGVASAVMPLSVISILIHRSSIFIFCIVVNFSFGPLDNVSEFGHQLANIVKRKSMNKIEIEERDVKANVSTKVVSEIVVEKDETNETIDPNKV
ncbi:predicted protein [Naegleria gruberi]|uniref:Predicted protein n=1 Tax=Naegleria gruberi TaxID=5762 RepID=D2VW73_NAEGR|nr:uncharacterized protein NAEGRDRAFT_73280 [Naegleria gruberi]EFC39030.1 predicted protein [Naegleria gruberi]|eukprot:XP_002671774.1 predicted protein [Naegleria gruberi strain NEG-M]